MDSHPYRLYVRKDGRWQAFGAWYKTAEAASEDVDLARKEGWTNEFRTVLRGSNEERELLSK